MASDSPTTHSVRKHVYPPSSTLSPAQAIAEAWKRESKENQERWKKIDADVKTRFNAPRRPERKTKM
ncbi:hypothetical protein CVT26_008153 [Gymnopilus dilepis]|uniref:HMG box domain-containing protein n=1 Tax=Gymnopilus dilepis TaxID=231916 RepID=A0A409XX32_9AGAR|nr:hypothetical protein CVT26_008153 [Gymnopilus dilepis]